LNGTPYGVISRLSVSEYYQSIVSEELNSWKISVMEIFYDMSA